jgi:Ca2+/H+ antiporter
MANWSQSLCWSVVMIGKAWRKSLFKQMMCHRQIFWRETASDLTAKSSAIEMKRGFQVL